MSGGVNAYFAYPNINKGNYAENVKNTRLAFSYQGTRQIARKVKFIPDSNRNRPFHTTGVSGGGKRILCIPKHL